MMGNRKTPPFFEVEHYDDWDLIPAGAEAISLCDGDARTCNQLWKQGQVEYVSFWECDLSTSDFSSIIQLQCLRYISLGKCDRLEDGALEALATLPLLQTLEITDCAGLTGNAIRAIAKASHLQKLVFHCDEVVSGAQAQPLEGCIKLVELNLAYAGTEPFQDLCVFRFMPELRYLDLCGWRGLGVRTAEALSHCQHLETILLGSTDVGGRFLDWLVHLPCLKHVDLSGCDVSEDGALKYLARSPSIEQLVLQECGELSFDDVASLSKLRSLKRLSLDRCRGLDAASISALKDCRQLQWLSLAYCSGLTGEVFSELARLEGVRELDVSGCDGMTVSALRRILQLPSLEKIDLRGCSSLREAEIQLVAINFPVEVITSPPFP